MISLMGLAGWVSSSSSSRVRSLMTSGRAFICSMGELDILFNFSITLFIYKIRVIISKTVGLCHKTCSLDTLACCKLILRKLPLFERVPSLLLSANLVRWSSPVCLVIPWLGRSVHHLCRLPPTQHHNSFEPNTILDAGLRCVWPILSSHLLSSWARKFWTKHSLGSVYQNQRSWSDWSLEQWGSQFHQHQLEWSKHFRWLAPI